MTVKKIRARSILRRFRRMDSWFIAKAGLNLYRGCAHDCAYCDGRAEKYRVEGEFGRDVAVKVNAVDVLLRELRPRPAAQPELWPNDLLPSRGEGFIVLGGGVGDSYQPAEAHTLAARRVLELFE